MENDLDQSRERYKTNLDLIDLEKMREKITEQPGLVPFPHHVGSAVVKPIDEGRIRGKAMAAMVEQTNVQLKQLYDQMQTLMRQAAEIRLRVEVSERVYQAQMNIEPVIGQTYFLYERDDHSDMVSMISPEEWGKPLPFKRCIARLRLLSDHTWEVNEHKA